MMPDAEGADNVLYGNTAGAGIQPSGAGAIGARPATLALEPEARWAARLRSQLWRPGA